MVPGGFTLSCISIMAGSQNTYIYPVSSSYSLRLMGLAAVAAWLLLYWSCANPVAPTGGPMDTTPPQIDTTRYSTPNMLTGFDKSQITLTFDEWFELYDPFNQILVSPTINPRPEFRVRGKRLLISLDPEVLEENTTYSIYFGESIRDITERNVLENFRYVFSTGPYIDSLYLTTRVTDAESGEPLARIAVMLYPEYSDSLLMTTKPFYAARTNNNGVASFENLRAGQYHVRALLDQNASYTYDLPNEKIGFIREPVESMATPDSVIRIRLFQEPVPYRVQSTHRPFPQMLSIALNQPGRQMDSISVFPAEAAMPQHQFYRDSLWLWVVDDFPDSLEIWLHGSRSPLSVKTPDPVLSMPGAPSVARDPGTGTGAGRGQTARAPVVPAILKDVQKQVHNRPLVLELDRPIAQTDSSKFQLWQGDTLQIEESIRVTRHEDGMNKLAVMPPWLQDSAYVLIILPGGMTDVFGETNDSIRISIEVLSSDQTGQIALAVTNMKEDIRYIIALLSGETTYREWCVKGSPEFRYTLNDMPAGNYRLRITEDLRENCRWDTGNYLEKRQPERIWMSDQATLRANWDMDLHWQIPD